MEKKLDGNYTRMLWEILNKSWRQNPTKQQLYGHLPPITKICRTRLEKWGRTPKRYTPVDFFHMDEQRQDDQLEPIYNCVPIQEVASKSYWERWTRETGSERERGRVKAIRAGVTTWWWYIEYLKEPETSNSGFT